jgi:hypothetical protein
MATVTLICFNKIKFKYQNKNKNKNQHLFLPKRLKPYTIKQLNINFNK